MVKAWAEKSRKRPNKFDRATKKIVEHCKMKFGMVRAFGALFVLLARSDKF